MLRARVAATPRSSLPPFPSNGTFAHASRQACGSVFDKVRVMARSSRSRSRVRGSRRSRSRSAGRRPESRTKVRSRERSRDRGHDRRSPLRGSREGGSKGGGAEREDRGPGNGGTSLLIRNIGDRCAMDDLRGAFERYGGIKDVYIPMDHRTRRPKPFAFVEFFKPEDAAVAKTEMDNREIRGSTVSVIYAEKGRKSADSMRKQDGGGGGGGGGYRSRGHRSRSRSGSRSRQRRFISRSPQRCVLCEPAPRACACSLSCLRALSLVLFPHRATLSARYTSGQCVSGDSQRRWQRQNARKAQEQEPAPGVAAPGAEG